MNEGLSKIFVPLKEQYQKLSKRTKIIALVVILLVIVVAIIAASILNNKEYVVLFPNANSDESQEILIKLQEMGEVNNYMIRGDTVMVLKEDEARLKAALIFQGYPKSGFTYAHSLESGFMSTEKDKENLLRIDLETRMAATIQEFDDVSTARVTITPATKSQFALTSEKASPARVSITLKMKNNDVPSDKLIKAIRKTAMTVDDLDEENITIADSQGNYWDLETDVSGNQITASDLKAALESAKDEYTEKKVMSLLQPRYGEDKVAVTATSRINIDKRIDEIMNYIPSEEGDGNTGVTEQVQQSDEMVADGETIGGVVGTEQNTEIPVYPAITTDGNNIYAKSERDIKFLVSYEKQQIERDSDSLEELSLSVMIDGERPPQAEYDELRTNIGIAAGIIPEDAANPVNLINRVGLIFAPFDRPIEPPIVDPTISIWEQYPQLIWIIIATAGIIFLLTMMVVILILKRRKQVILPIEDDAEETDDEEDKSIFDVDLLETNLAEAQKSREAELKEQITEFADTNPEISAQLLRTWMRGDEVK